MAKRRTITYKSDYDDGDAFGPYTYTSGSDLLVIHPNGKVALTGDGGLAVKLINATNTTTQKGQVVTASTGSQRAYELTNNQFVAIGYVYEPVAPGEEGFVVVSGIADVMVQGATSAGDHMIVYTAPGTATASVPPAGLSALATSEHFKEIGHCLETHASGSNYTIKIVTHFN